MEPTSPFFMPILKFASIIVFASIPFVLGILFNTIPKYRKGFFIAGKVVSALLTLFILGLAVFFIHIHDGDPNIPQHYYILGCSICTMLFSALPVSTFYFTIRKTTKKKRLGFLATSFIVSFFTLSASEELENRAFGFEYKTERTEMSLDEFYKEYPEADRSSDINLLVFMADGGKWFDAYISVYKDSITLKTISTIVHFEGKNEIDSCYSNDLPRDLVQDIIEEVTHYQPEIEYASYADLCLHPSESIVLANNKKATAIKLGLPDLDGFHPKAQRIAKKINDLVKNSKIDPTKGCRN